MLKTTLISIFTFCYLFLHSQNYNNEYQGYIISSENDSIVGTVKLNNNVANKNVCDFKKVQTKRFNQYQPHEIKAYGIHNGRRFHSRLVKSDTTSQQYFLELLLDGIVDFYLLHNLDKNSYYIEKDRIIYELSIGEFIIKDEYQVSHVRSSEQYKSILKQLFEDSEIPETKINKTRFSQAALVDLTKEYHNNVCDSYDCIDYTKKYKSKRYLEFHVGIPRTKISLVDFDQTVHSNNSTFGILFITKPKNSFKSIEFILGATLTNTQSFLDWAKDTSSEILQRNELRDFDFSYLSLPIGFRYYFNNDNRLRVFGGLQFETKFILKNNYFVESYLTMPSNPDYRYVENNANVDLKFPFFGLSGNAGISYFINQKSSLSFSIYKEYNLPLPYNGIEQFTISQTGLLLSYKHGIN